MSAGGRERRGDELKKLNQTTAGGAMEGTDPLWLDAMEMMDSDLHWLLQQPHHKFWCQVREVQRFLIKFHVGFQVSP